MAFADRVTAGLGAGVFIPAVLQHFALGAVTLAVPRVIAQAAGADALLVQNYCQLAMMALGIATLLQAWGWRGIGSGYLLPACFAGIYVAPAMAVATENGLGAVAGLTVVAGLTQVVLSRFLRHLRGFIPADVIGVGVLMIGLAWGMFGLRLMCGVTAGETSARLEWVSGLVALFAMVCVSVWGSKGLRPVAVLIGFGAGCLTTAAMFLVIGSDALILPEHMFVIPRWPLFAMVFDDSYLPGFMVGAVASLLRVAGDVIASHQVSDLNWKRPNTRIVASGGLAEGLGNIVSGFIGTMPVNTSSGSVGFVAASGISSREVAYGVGVLWIAMSLLPFGAPMLMLIPEAVQGAAVFFTGGFVMRSGIAMLTQRMIDNRRAITIGSALIVGLSFDDLVRALALSPEVRTVLTSALLTSVAVAILMTAVFRIGVKKTVKISWNVSEPDTVLKSWIQSHGKLWVARTELIAKAEAVMEEFAQAAPGLAAKDVQVAAHYDEIALKLEFAWQGKALGTVPGRTGGIDLDAADESVALHLAVAMIRHMTDHVAETSLPDGRHRLVVTLDDL